MEDLFAKFIAEEFEWIFSNSDSAKYILEGFDNKITEDEFYDHFEVFKERVTDMTSNDEWLIQQIHERMDDMLIDILKDYLNYKNNKEE